MIRQHGTSACNMCGRHPNVGWLYACRQDWLLARQSTSSHDLELPHLPIESDDLDHLTEIAIAVGMSHSVVAQMRSKSYTVTDAKKIIADKVHMLNVIKAEESTSAQHSPPESATGKTGEAASSIIAALGTTVSSSTSFEAVSAAASNTTTCTYMVCHTCRPFLHDRVPVTIAAIINGTEPAISSNEMQYLRMVEPAVISKLGTRPAPIRRLRQFGLGLTSTDITSQQKDGADENSTPSDWTSSDISSGVYEDDDNGPFVHVDPFPCPGPGFCPVASYEDGCAYDGDFDDGKRAINDAIVIGHHTDTTAGAEHNTPDCPRYRLRRVEGNVSDTPGRASSTGSSVSLPTPTTMPLTPITPSDGSSEDVLNDRINGKPVKVGKAATICGRLDSGAGGDMSSRSSSSSLGSEVAVADGVALTEEAVEAHIPNIKYEE
ncbi:hypothetical protein B0A48_00145 [Cryoendolithus antarcticus]|uniref:Uncharacterized protein n=1 Tax=Cryoendolithus antarcticus TaxID=1507870 RepID=A0A1V8TTY0_9PEZI|nr:hypothetical protein B0A48_00145 [Cryoendolithus antarcticus]